MTIQVEVSSPGEREPESVLCTSGVLGQTSTPTSVEDEKSLESPETPQNTLVTDQLTTHDINNRSTNESGMNLNQFTVHSLDFQSLAQY